MSDWHTRRFRGRVIDDRAPTASTRPTTTPTTSERACARRESRWWSSLDSLSEQTGPVYGERPLDGSSTPTSPASMQASRSASESSSRAACSARDGKPLRGQLVEIWQANAAGRYHHAVDTARRAARPELQRRRPLPDRRRRQLPIRDREARRLPVGEPPERVAAEAHPLLALRPRVHRAARHADVLPRRPALPVRPDLQLDPRRARRERLVSTFDMELTEPDWALGLPLRHRARRPRSDTARGAAR